MGISIPQLLIILAILLLLFGTKRLRNIGSDLGDAIKGFRKAIGGDDDVKDTESKPVELEKKDADFDFKNSNLKDDHKSDVKTASESAQDKK